MNPWITVIVSVLFGGAAGAIINNYISYRRGKKQPVWYDISVTSVFKSLQLPGKNKATVAMLDKDENTIFSIENLYIARIDLINTGNKDFEAFTFHLSVANAAKIIAIDESTKGTQHETHYNPTIALDSSVDNVTIKCDPFNRKDIYSFTLYLTCSNDEPLSVKQIKLDTKHPVNLVLANKLDELNQEGVFTSLIKFIFNTIAGIAVVMIGLIGIFGELTGFHIKKSPVEKNEKGTMVTTKSFVDSSSVDTFIISGDKAYRIEKSKK